MDHPMTRHDGLASIKTLIDGKVAHHEAGHAVASVARGGRLLKMWELTKPATRTQDAPMNHPFVIFAGPWAQAKWFTATGESESLRDELVFAWEENSGYAWSGDLDGVAIDVRSDADCYESEIRQLSGNPFWPELGYDDSAKGYTEIGRYWEARWNDELSELWTAICAVAGMLLDGVEVTNEMVLEAVEGCR